MKPELLFNLFWAVGGKVYLKKKVKGVVRYQIYSSLNPLEIVLTNARTYHFEDGEVLEVTVEYLPFEDFYKRRFFQYDANANVFHELFFEEKDEYEEGEDVLLKHLGLVNEKAGKLVNGGLEKLIQEKNIE
ncbi:MAG: hypothetical protein IJ220_00675 [Clostridia bacterium]|nr:hypothetical protein [Clostridia bacterium]